jgi:hypothetical protein
MIAYIDACGDEQATESLATAARNSFMKYAKHLGSHERRCGNLKLYRSKFLQLNGLFNSLLRCSTSLFGIIPFVK